MLSRTLPRTLTSGCRFVSTASKTRQAIASEALTASPSSSYYSRSHRKQKHLYRSLLTIAFAGGIATLTQYYLINNGSLTRSSQAESPSQQSKEETIIPLVFEQSRKQPGLSKEENRDLISSQHHQVKRSWESPGVYAWGSNSGRVVAPDRPEESVIKTPRRIEWFDGRLLRDVKLDRYFGVAIDERGDLIQWGTAYKPDIRAPETTLKGKDLVGLCISRDRILGLSGNGKVYSIPVSAEDQASGTKVKEAGWIPFWTGKSDIAYRILAPRDLEYREKVVRVEGGLEHAILLTSKGRVFSAASASDRYPTRGQLGVPGISWVTRPEGAFDQPHEITTLKGFSISSIACGDWHTLALDKEGRVFTWGDNASGQLGFEFNAESMTLDAPSLLPTQRLYLGQGQVPKITSVAAGGNNSYITVDATRVASPHDATTDERTLRMLGRVTADTFAFGSGIYGTLANNRWTHVQPTPTKIPTLSGLFEYDEQTHRTVPIRLAHLSVGATHAAAVMSNITNVSVTSTTSSNTRLTPDDTNWGADILFWGGNEFWQLGTGKRNNLPVPTYIQPLDLEAETKRARRSSGGSSSSSREEHRFHITPRADVVLGDGRRRVVEQRVVCGRGVTGVYSGSC